MRFLIRATMLALVLSTFSTVAGAQGYQGSYGQQSYYGQQNYYGQQSYYGQQAPCVQDKCGVGAWTLAADALFLERSNPTSGILVFNTALPSQQIRADQFDLGTEAGVEFSLASRLGPQGSVELSYFGVEDWGASFNTLTMPNNLLQLNAAIPVFVASGNAITANYSSELDSAEINFSYATTDWFSVSAGFRYLELDENSSIRLLNAAVPFQYANATRNRMYGSQFGANVCLWDCELHAFSVIGKAGVYGNHAAHSGSISTPAATSPVRGEANRTAFAGEIKTRSQLRLTNHCSLLSGYRLLWLDGVALASDQLGASNFFNGAGIDGTGNVFYHGAYVGLECRY